MKLAFELAKSADTDMLLQFMQEFYAFDHLEFEEEGARRALTTLLNDASLGRVWLICADGVAIGYIVLAFGFSLEFRGRDAFVDEFYLRENYRGQGIGTQTLHFVEDACRALGIRALHLEVSRDNTPARRVYRAFGFEDHDRYLMTKIVQ